MIHWIPTRCLSLAAFSLLAFSACKKDENDNASPNKMTIGSETYTVDNVTLAQNSVALRYTSGPATGAIMTFYFGANGTTLADGVYKIVGRATSANEATLSVGVVTDNATTVYASQDGGSVSVSLINEGGKFRVVLPSVNVKRVSGGALITNASADAKER